MLTQPFADAVAEAEKIIVGAPHVRTEADLAEGYDDPAGNIRASLQLAWAYQRDFPYFVSSTGPYTKMGLDNPDALYFHSYLRDDAEYVVTGRRGTTTDLSFQVLDGDYSPVEVPGSLSAFGRPGDRDRRRRDVRAAVRPRRSRAQRLPARSRRGDASRPRGLQRLGLRAARHHRHPPGRPRGLRAARRRGPARWPSATGWPGRSCYPGCVPSSPSPSGSTSTSRSTR